MRITTLALGFGLVACHTSVDALTELEGAPDGGPPEVGTPDGGPEDAGADPMCEALSTLGELRVVQGRADPVKMGPTALLSGEHEGFGVFEDLGYPPIRQPGGLEGPRVVEFEAEPSPGYAFVRSVEAPSPFAMQGLSGGCNFALYSHEADLDRLEIELAGAFCGAAPDLALPAGRRPITPTVVDEGLYVGAADEGAETFSIHTRLAGMDAHFELEPGPFAHPRLLVVQPVGLGLPPPAPVPVGLYRPLERPGVLRMALARGDVPAYVDYPICGEAFDAVVQHEQLVVVTRCGGEVRLFLANLERARAAPEGVDGTAMAIVVADASADGPAPRVAMGPEGQSAVAYWEADARTPSVRLFDALGSARASGRFRMQDRNADVARLPEPSRLELALRGRNVAVLFGYDEAEQTLGTLQRFSLCPE